MTVRKSWGWSFGWFILTLVFGLAQVWVMGLISGLSVKIHFPYERIFLEEGIVLFFSIVLVSSLVIDHFVFRERETTNNDFIHSLSFSILPIALIAASVVVFTMGYLNETLPLKDVFDRLSIIIAQGVILVLTAVYAIIVKWHPSKPCEPCNLPPSTSTITPSQGETNEPDKLRNTDS